MAACSVLIVVIRRGWGLCNCQEGEASACKDKEKQMLSPAFSSLPAFPPFPPTPLAFYSLFGPPPFAPPPSAPPLWEGGLFDSDALTAGLGVGCTVASAGLRDGPWVWGAQLFWGRQRVASQAEVCAALGSFLRCAHMGSFTQPALDQTP